MAVSVLPCPIPLYRLASFATSYPDADPMRAVAKETATSSLALLKTFNGRVESTTSQHKQMEALVRVYLAEIEGVEKDIKTTLQAAKLELDMYAKKLEQLQAKTGSARDDTKIGRNLEKFEAARTAYDAAVEAVTTRQKGIWDKRQVAFTALFCGFFSSQATAMSQCMSTLSDTFSYVDEHRDALANLDQEMGAWAGVEPVAAGVSTLPTSLAVVPAGGKVMAVVGGMNAKVAGEVGESVTPPAPSSPAAAADAPAAA